MLRPFRSSFAKTAGTGEFFRIREGGDTLPLDSVTCVTPVTFQRAIRSAR